jgi:multiple antibiotic resistance protein
VASESKAAIAVVPLGIPLLAGPGAISAVIIQMDRGSGLTHVVLVLLAILLVAVSCWVTLRYAERVGRFVGPIGLNVVIRLFGLVLAAIAVETIANGLRGLFPVLVGT